MTKKSTSSVSDAFAVALRLLGRCDRSSAQLREKLEQRGFSGKEIDAAIVRCRSYNYLDDERYALARSRALMRSGKGVGVRILLDLKQRGIDPDIAWQALQTVETEFCSEQLLQQELERRFPSFRYLSADARQRRRVIHYFLRRGFPLDQIMAQLKQKI